MTVHDVCRLPMSQLGVLLSAGPMGRVLSGFAVVLGLLPLICAGCSSGGLAEEEEAAEKPEVRYAGLAGQKCAILVWVDSFTRTEFNQVQIDLARALQGKLAKKPSQDEKQPAKPDPSSPQFIDPRSVVLYQRQHPEIEGLTIAEIAPHLGVPRVIYVEIEQLQTQSPRSILLLKGIGKATLRVVEVADNKAVVVFEEAGITAKYPRNVRDGVVPTDKINERTVYEGTLVELATKLAARLPTEK